ncbi:DNA mismatch repair protein MutT [Deinococcus irradiatisoli]|uniref:DNA mismatch repair protein MutT n=1 Tax=Deinococcus irradiatisoli TaxID=2202254 RepID=A0A2Z3JD12_9DEIO|nr:NUDIX hydrolase [Deinococcus irradiatisoli]AWN21926.1 DNA mismatch repair protein MutT [Deinococcus irradiatisoli]
MTEHPQWAELVPESEQPWQTLSSTELVGPPRRLVRDTVRAHGGQELSYVYRPRGPSAVFVLPITPAGEAVLIRQYRYPLGAHITEVVAGGIEEGEQPAQAGARELLEEVGGISASWVALPGFYPQPSISGVVFYPLLALDVALGEAQLEISELIERLVLPLPEVYRRLSAGEIFDGPSSLVLFQARRHLEERGYL